MTKGHFVEKYATPISIAVAGLFIAGAIVISKSMPAKNIQPGSKPAPVVEGTLDLKKILAGSRVNQKELATCIANQETKEKVERDIAMGQAAGLQGTPHMVISITKDGITNQFPLSGAQPKQVIEQVIAAGTSPDGTTITPVQEITADDHVLGDRTTALATVIEYSDIDCPFCKRLHPTLQALVNEGKIAWVFRHSPIPQLHPDAYNKAVTAECIAKLGGNDAFWKYLDATAVTQ
jgi:protein-disulfide isomerase